MLSDLSVAARLYCVGHCRGDLRRAEAIALIVFGGASVRSVAKRHRLPASTLHRLSRTLRTGLHDLVAGRVVGVDELLARHARSKP